MKNFGENIPLFRLAFRPFFLFGAMFSIACLILWIGFLKGLFTFPVYGGSFWWHTHEMLFGFFSAIMVGFLLTAVQTWTKLPSLKGFGLAVLLFLWLLARVLMLVPHAISPWVIMGVDLLFLPAAGCVLAHLVIRASQWRNIIFVPLILAMTCINGVMHFSVIHDRPALSNYAATIMVFLIALLMCVIGGRVFPMFTANGTKTDRVSPIPWLEKFSIGSLLTAAFIQIWGDVLALWLVNLVLLVTAITHMIRALRWRLWVTLTTPLVWPLHISYLAIPLGLFMLILANVSDVVSHSQALHCITVGGMGLMILAMITRVSLGHTGRSIQVARFMTFAFCALVTSFLLRVFGPFVFASYINLITVSAFTWCIGYGCFVIFFCPILIKPRRDGKPG